MCVCVCVCVSECMCVCVCVRGGEEIVYVRVLDVEDALNKCGCGCITVVYA